jgi:hypothetical protein
MTDEIKPALTAEEWAEQVCEYPATDKRPIVRRTLWTFDNGVQVSVGTDGVFVNWDGAVYDSGMQALGDRAAAVMALINHGLSDESPYKIARADVDALIIDLQEPRVWNHALGEADRNAVHARLVKLLALAAKLAALLPPDERTAGKR